MSTQSVHGAFERQARLRPHQLAVRHLTERVTYAELNARADGLAIRLRQQGVRQGDIVAISLPRCVELIVAMLAVLKVGAAYLPLDGDCPVSRNAGYLRQAAVRCVISDTNQTTLTEHRKIVTVPLSANPPSATEHTSSGAGMHDKAYIMFTSGSCGTPKGVVVPHRAICRLVLGTNYIEILPTDRLLQLSSPSFDASTFEIWGALLNGATLVLYSGTTLDPNLLRDDIRENGITIIWLTAALFHLIADKWIEALEPVDTVVAGGDVLNPKYVNKLLDKTPTRTVINGYGPTENTTFTCCHRMTNANRPSGIVPIGKPVSGTDVYVLNNELQPVSRGEVGELFASGLGLALGYVGAEDDNGAFFRDDSICNGLIYRTGDLVRENDHEELEFVGRKDNQVKVRGYRVCLEEVTASLTNLAYVNDAVVVHHRQGNSGDPLLLALVLLRKGFEVDIAKIKDDLASAVPTYMIPNRIVLEPTLSLNKNGKIDKQMIWTYLRAQGYLS